MFSHITLKFHFLFYVLKKISTISVLLLSFYKNEAYYLHFVNLLYFYQWPVECLLLKSLILINIINTERVFIIKTH